jgi:signal transduction histidine kinase
LTVQYYLNLSNEAANVRQNDRQQRALKDGITLGVSGITADDSLTKIFAREEGNLDKYTKARLKDILVIDNNWNVYESLNEENKPGTDENGDAIYKKFADIKDLPPLMDADRLGDARSNFPNAEPDPNDLNDREAYAIPVDTTKGTWYVMVILDVNRRENTRRATEPLLYTLGVLLASSIIAIVLVWRFTKPIKNLSEAARAVAEGKLNVRVPDDTRSDEIGLLALRFNEMAAQLEKTRELESQLQEAEKSAVVGRLASAIAHEIRNPLNYINLTLDHLRAKFVPVEPEKRETFEKLTAQLKTEVGRINNQISDFLRYSRPMNLNLQPISIHEVVEASMRIVEAQAEGLGIDHIINETDPELKVLGDHEVLRSVFNNLFINAVQAMESTGGKLEVNIVPDGNMVAIKVSDTGGGISVENQCKIFEPYFSTKETGTGLGLAIVKRVIEKHNGTIEVNSVEGNGTEFVVKLPQA